jgi:hypothetical protein
VIDVHYLQGLREEFIQFLQGMGVNIKDTFFQQDRAWPLTVTAALNVHSDARVLSNYYPGHHTIQTSAHAIISYGKGKVVPVLN